MIGYNGPQFANLAKNLLSAYQQPEVINTALKKIVKQDDFICPFSTPPLGNFCTSGLGLVPKHNGEWRVIYHLSAPVDLSINDFIDSRHTRHKCTKHELLSLIGKLSYRFKH